MLVEQRSQQWFEIRRSKITSSEIHKIMGEKGLGETGKTYLLEKVCENFGGVPEPVSAPALDWGIELEPVAIDHYQEVTKTVVDKAPFLIVSDFYGGSPDGIVRPEGIIEVKCPFKSANHFKHGLINSPAKFKKVAPNYYYQCISNMICAEALWCDFISFDPRVSSDYRMFIYRLHFDPEEARAMKERIELAIEYMKELEEEIKKAKPELLLG